jgi:hypothetical protein
MVHLVLKSERLGDEEFEDEDVVRRPLDAVSEGVDRDGEILRLRGKEDAGEPVRKIDVSGRG